MEQKSNKTSVIIVVLAGLVLLGAIAYFVLANRETSSTEPSDSSSSVDTSTSDSRGTDTSAVDDVASSTDPVAIVFGDDGFVDSEYTVKAGQTVKVENKSSSMSLQFSSDDHPTHTHETELNLPVLAPGESDTFTPTKSGTWGFHDHINDQFTGKLVVTE